MIDNIYQRKDGRYEGRITIGYDNGKRQYKAFFGKTVEETAEKMALFRNKMTVPINVIKTFETVYEEWFQSISYRVKESTAANYTLKADKHILPKFGEQNIAEITQNSVYQFIRDKQNAGLSNRYITDILILMKSVFKYAARTYRIVNPMEDIIMPKKQKQEIRLLTAEEEHILEQYIAENQNLTTLGIVLTKLTGLRIGELCALKWEDIDLEKRILTVKRTVQRIQCKGEKSRTKLIITDHQILPNCLEMTPKRKRYSNQDCFE